MELVRVSEIRNLDFDHISDGQRQRVMLARAICQEPEILILDEPTSYLDVRHKLEFLSILQKLCRERQLTVILSLHELELAEKISDWILCVNGTAVERIGSPEEVMTEGYITHLYGIQTGSYDEASADMEQAAGEILTGDFRERGFPLQQVFCMRMIWTGQWQRRWRQRRSRNILLNWYRRRNWMRQKEYWNSAAK